MKATVKCVCHLCGHETTLTIDTDWKWWEFPRHFCGEGKPQGIFMVKENAG